VVTFADGTLTLHYVVGISVRQQSSQIALPWTPSSKGALWRNYVENCCRQSIWL
jgi:hypothetical protein